MPRTFLPFAFLLVGILISAMTLACEKATSGFKSAEKNSGEGNIISVSEPNILIQERNKLEEKITAKMKNLSNQELESLDSLIS